MDLVKPRWTQRNIEKEQTIGKKGKGRYDKSAISEKWTRQIDLQKKEIKKCIQISEISITHKPDAELLKGITVANWTSPDVETPKRENDISQRKAF